jgi:hypothetical protein
MLLENIPLFWNLKNTLQENMGYLIHHLFFFQAGIKVPIVVFSKWGDVVHQCEGGDTLLR